MKQCAYCGRNNEDEATWCQECGTAEFVFQKTPIQEVDAAVGKGVMPNHPKFIIVIGMWLVCGSGLLFNLLGLYAAFDWFDEGFPGAMMFLLFLGGSALCVYLMRRSLKNYLIHKQRFEEALKADALRDSGEMKFSHPKDFGTSEAAEAKSPPFGPLP